MKIRIKGNSVRFRLTKSEVETLCKEGLFQERTSFPTLDFVYSVKSSAAVNLEVDFKENEIQVLVPSADLQRWDENNRVGFYHSWKTSSGQLIDITLEKDFVCLDTRDEDESDNYPNPKAETATNEE